MAAQWSYPRASSAAPRERVRRVRLERERKRRQVVRLAASHVHDAVHALRHVQRYEELDHAEHHVRVLCALVPEREVTSVGSTKHQWVPPQVDVLLQREQHVSKCVRRQVVRAVVARPVERRAPVRHAVHQQEQHAQLTRRLVQSVRPQPMRARRNVEPAYGVHEEPERGRGRARRVRDKRHVQVPVHAQRVQSAQVHQHRPPHPLQQRHAQLRVLHVVLA